MAYYRTPRYYCLPVAIVVFILVLTMLILQICIIILAGLLGQIYTTSGKLRTLLLSLVFQSH